MLLSPVAALRHASLRIVAFVALLTLIACGGAEEPPPASGSGEPMAPAAQARAAAIQSGYAGSEACAACHAEEHASWESSFHQAIFRPGDRPAWHENPPPTYSSEDLVVVPLADGSGLRVERGGARGTFAIDAVIGGKRLEAYATKLEDGAYLMLPIAYQVQNQTFLPYTEGTCGIEVLDGSRVIAWQSFQRVWNHRCIDCHTTAGDIGFQPRSMTYRTTFIDAGAGCESCHGPGEEHIGAVREGGAPGSIFNPGRLDAQAEVEVCASCHALGLPFNTRWGGHRPYRPGDDWAQAFLPLLRPASRGLSAGLSHADLTPSTGVMAYQGLTQSLCHMEGQARCSTCHDAHAGGVLATGTEADAVLCGSCHEEVVAAGEAHSHHLAGKPGGACVDCHMPPLIEAQGTRLASHAIDVPLPVNNVQYGIPDACTQCHADRGADWADAAYRRLWGDPAGQRRRALAQAFAGEDADGLKRVLADVQEAPLLRANAAAALARKQGVAAIPDLLAVLDESTPLLVRRYAVDYLGGMGAAGDLPVAERMAHLRRVEEAGVQDALRQVADAAEPVLRLGAAAALARLGAGDGLSRLEQLAQDPALAGGYRVHYTLAKYNLLNGRLDEAAREFELVLEMTPNYLDAIQDLGFVYFSSERFTEARDLWMRGLTLDPGNEVLRQRVHLAEDEMRKTGALPPVSGD